MEHVAICQQGPNNVSRFISEQTMQSSKVSIFAILDCEEFLPKVPLFDKTEAKTLLEAVAPLGGGGGGGGGSRLLLPWFLALADEMGV